MLKHEVLVYLPLKPSAAKMQNLPVKLPVRIEDLPKIVDQDKIDLDIIIRGLETQHRVKADDYYDSYLLFFYYEAFKRALNNGNVDDAKIWLEKAGKLKIDYRYFFYKGLLLREVGELDQSEIELRKAVEMNQDFYVGYYELGRLLQKKGEYDEAVKFHIKSLEHSHGEFDLPLLGVVDAYSASGMLSTALEVLERIPGDSQILIDALLRKGVILNELQRYAEAEKVFNMALHKEKRWELFYNRAYARERLGKLYPAFSDLKESYNLNSVEDILYDMALVEREMGFIEDAIEHLSRYLSVSNDAAAEIALARCYFMLGDFEKASSTLPISLEERLSEFIALCSSLAIGEIKNGNFTDLLFSNLQREYKKGRMTEKISKLRRLSSSLTGVENLFVSEEVDYQELMQWLLKHFDNPSLNNRVSGITMGKVPAERELSVEELKAFIQFLPFFGIRFDRMELFARRFAFILSGKGETLAMLLTLLKLYIHALANMAIDIATFIEELVEEFKSYAFDFSKFIAEAFETQFIDVDTALESVPETPRDFILKTLSLVRADALAEASISDKIYIYFRR